MCGASFSGFSLMLIGVVAASTKRLLCAPPSSARIAFKIQPAIRPAAGACLSVRANRQSRVADGAKQLRASPESRTEPTYRCTMPQPFGRWTNVVSRFSILGVVLLLAGAIWVGLMIANSSYGTGAGVAVVQSPAFSHQHHVGLLGIDCRFCHTSVEQSSYAGMPATSVCMNCHSQIWVGSEMLSPVRESYRDNRPLEWQRVYNTPGFVYFDHSIHVQKGVGCTTCHGDVGQMPFTYQVPTLLMKWCLDCHRDPAQHLRPKDDIFDVNYRRSEHSEVDGQRLMESYNIRSAKQLTSCSVCHR